MHVLLERFAARRAQVTIGASDDLVVRARRAGAIMAGFALTAFAYATTRLGGAVEALSRRWYPR